ncbi:MAG: peptidase, partial [Anaerotignum sp.]|nr:peptidase [Anaerotignum sp.]
MEQYYYNTLTKPQQNSYNAIKAGLQSLAPSFPVPLLENRELTDVFMKLRLDHPQLFYAGTFKYRYYPDGSNAEFIPEYLFDAATAAQMQKEVEKVAENWLKEAPLSGSDYEKSKWVYETLVRK